MRLARPCDKDWDSMPGDDRVRFCSGCAKSVYNISDMTTREAKDFLRARGVTECMRMFRRADGTVINDECPRIFRKIRNGARFVARTVAAIVGLVMSTSVVSAQTAESLKKDGGLDLLSQFKDVEPGPGKVTVTPIPPVVTGTVGDMGEFRFESRPKLDDWEVATAIRGKAFGISPNIKQFLLQETLYGPSNDLEGLIIQATAKQQQSDPAKIDLALCLMARDKDGDRANARELLEVVRKKVPRDTAAVYSLAVLDELERRSDAAAAKYWDIYKRDSSFKQAAVNLFDLYLRQGNKPAARQVLEELLKTMQPYAVRLLLSADLKRLDKGEWPPGLTAPPNFEPEPPVLKTE